MPYLKGQLCRPLFDELRHAATTQGFLAHGRHCPTRVLHATEGAEASDIDLCHRIRVTYTTRSRVLLGLVG
jgi:hypothetical protein